MSVKKNYLFKCKDLLQNNEHLKETTFEILALNKTEAKKKFLDLTHFYPNFVLKKINEVENGIK